MRLASLEDLAKIAIDSFERYVEPYALSMMYGEVPSVQLCVHRRGTLDEDWLARVSFKNGVAISVMKCELWLDDAFRLARRIKAWLITNEAFSVISLYAMLHPVFQLQYLNFSKSAHYGYDSMMSHAGDDAYAFMLSNYSFTDEVEPVIVDMLRYHMMEYSNRWKGATIRDYRESQRAYESIMMKRYERAYRMARSRKATTGRVDLSGAILLERRRA